MGVSLRTVLVSGGLGGLGKAVCDVFNNKGWDVLITTSQGEKVGEKVFYWNMKEVGSSKALMGQLPDIDCFIHCAHIFSPTRLSLQIKDTEFSQSLKNNLVELFSLSRDLARKMRRNGSGSIMYLGSYLALAPVGGKLSYITEKMSMQGMLSAFQSEFRNLNFSILHPGLINTPQVMSKISNKVLSVVGKENLLDTKDVASEVFYIIQNPSSQIIYEFKGNQNWKT